MKKIEWNKIELHHVTPLSKAVALALFVALPFIGFYFGVQYGKTKALVQTTRMQVQAQKASFQATTTVPVLPPETVLLPVTSTTFSYPYPVSWRDGSAEFSITGISLGRKKISSPYVFRTGSGGGAYAIGEEIQALTLYLKIVSKAAEPGCIPVNMRRLINEEGDLAASNSGRFALQYPTGACTAFPDTSYFDQEAIFAVQESERSFLITTGGASGVFFNVIESDDGTLRLEKLSKEG